MLKKYKLEVGEIGVYTLFNPETYELYVGSGVLPVRYKGHYYQLRKNIHKNYKLQNAWNRNPNFIFDSVRCDNREEAFDFEQLLIDENWGKRGFLNLEKNARGGGSQHTPETIEKIRKANLGLKRSEEAKRNMSEAQKGKVLSDEHKQKLSMASTGKIFSEETKQKQRDWIRTPEQREKARLSNLGLKRTAETIENIRRTQIGKIVSATARESYRIGQTGRIHSEETKIKRRKFISLDGVIYCGICEAANILGLHYNSVTDRIKSNNPKWSNWFYIEAPTEL